MRRVPIAVAVVAAALVVLALLGTFTGTTAAPVVLPTIATAPVTSVTKVCSDLYSPTGTTSHLAVADVAAALSPPSQSAGTVTATVLAGANSTTTPLRLGPGALVSGTAKTNQTIALTATGSVAASLAADLLTETPVGRTRGLSGVGCEAPATDWWFAGADGRVGYSDTLMLANPSPTPAVVSVSLWGSKGSVLSPRLQTIQLRAQSTLRISIADNAPDVAQLGVHVHAVSGAVTAALFDQRTSALKSDGADFIPATEPPSHSLVVAGFASGKGPRRLMIADPGGTDATVSLRLVTTTGSFTPTGGNQVVVRGGRTKIVNLDRAFDGSTGAVELRSDQPVIAEGLSVTLAPPQRPDLMWLAAVPAISGPAAIADGSEPDGGHTQLLLAAPAGAAQVRVSTPSGATSTISVGAGRSVSIDITSTVRTNGTQWPLVVTPIGTAPVYGVRVLSFLGAHGALMTGEPLLSLPKPIPLPPVRADPLDATG